MTLTHSRWRPVFLCLLAGLALSPAGPCAAARAHAAVMTDGADVQGGHTDGGDQGDAHQDDSWRPRLMDDGDYTEYWEQQFLFDGGSLVTGQFLITNLPLSKHHGLMIATLKPPGGAAIVIKNGRQRSGWRFDGGLPGLTVFQHRISGRHPDYLMRLHNTAAELDVSYTAGGRGLAVTRPGDGHDLPEVTLYAPTAAATARWRPGPEIGGAGPDGAWQDLGGGAGYGLHVVQKHSLNHTLRRWRRVTSVARTADHRPVLHDFITPDGDRHTVLLMLPPRGPALTFRSVEVLEDETSGSRYITARAGDMTVKGTITLTGTLEDFILKDLLNGVEKALAGPLADIVRHRHKATYSLTLAADGLDIHVGGTALAEDIVIGSGRTAGRRGNRRVRR